MFVLHTTSTVCIQSSGTNKSFFPPDMAKGIGDIGVEVLLLENVMSGYAL